MFYSKPVQKAEHSIYQICEEMNTNPFGIKCIITPTEVKLQQNGERLKDAYNANLTFLKKVRLRQ